jgi:hypothetical protein
VSVNGYYKSLDKAIRDSLWLEPTRWAVGENGRLVIHEDGLELIKPVVRNRWVVSNPIGYVKLSWYTNFVISAMVHREVTRK